MSSRRNYASNEESKMNPAPPKSMVATMFKRPDSARKENKPQEKSDSLLQLKTDTFTTPSNSAEEEKIPELDERVKKQYDTQEVDDISASIPTLDEEQRESIQKIVTIAPDFYTHKIQSLKELEKDLQNISMTPNQPQFQVKDKIDFGILTTVLYSPHQIAEEDIFWNEQIFRSALYSFSKVAKQ